MSQNDHQNDHNNQNLIGFFPRKKSESLKNHLISQQSSLKLPYLYNKQYHNSIEVERRIKVHKRSLSSYDVTVFEPAKLKGDGELYKYLSSKVDFFNQQNQRRLSLKKRKVMVDLGIVRFQKEKIIPSNKNSKVSPAMMKLLKNYLLKRSSAQNRDDQYYVIGRQS